MRYKISGIVRIPMTAFSVIMISMITKISRISISLSFSLCINASIGTLYLFITML